MKNLKKIINKILVSFIIIIICYNLIYLIYKSFNGSGEIAFRNKIIVAAKDNTMYPEIKENDIVIFNKDINIAEKDIVLINNTNIQIARITKQSKNNMEKTYIVKGDHNYYNYDEEINETDIKGEFVRCIPIIGGIIKVLQSKIITVFSILILIFLYVYYKNMERKSNKRRQIKK